MLLVPSAVTLKKYGLSEERWKVFADVQKHACFVCEQEPKKGRLCIDHDHVAGWKNMPAEERCKYVRGLLCFRCNTTYVGRSITIERSKRVTLYLEAYESRKPAKPVKPAKQEKSKPGAI
jgi:hypothetical protein